MRLSLWFWRRVPPTSKAPEAAAARDGWDGQGDDVDYATLCDGRVVAVPRSQPARAEALLAAQEAAERRLRACLREAVRERWDDGPGGPRRAA